MDWWVDDAEGDKAVRTLGAKRMAAEGKVSGTSKSTCGHEMELRLVDIPASD